MAKSEGWWCLLLFEYKAKDLKKKEKKKTNRGRLSRDRLLQFARVYLEGPGEATDVPSF